MIRYFNRVTRNIETEKVYGGQYLEWAYQNPLGRILTNQIFSKRWLSHVFGAVENSRFSRRKINEFVAKYDIRMDDYEETEYSCFNDFFIRKFKAGKRPFSSSALDFCAGAEARYLVFTDLKPHQRFEVKGIEVDLRDLLGDENLARDFEGGSLILARLCPVDYHRFHFPFDGSLIRHERVPGNLHSVNPVAFKSTPRVFLENERQVAILENPVMGKVAMIEVGALGVGKIVQSAYTHQTPLPLKFEKGQEKGYFLFGGSTVIWLLEKDKIKLEDDLIRHSAEGLETWVPLGQKLGGVD